ncbi:putative transporter [Trachipleistophora hominis]|uniref:Putative transporter n=1 Tax=Trachipleistophora hominis TaxID=72359 RepID=L7JZR9_TRAHO|nr:putative transporter [Trachipleistophora hominis]
MNDRMDGKISSNSNPNTTITYIPNTNIIITIPTTPSIPNLSKWLHTGTPPHCPWLYPSLNIHSYTLLNIFDPYYHPLVMLYISTFIYLLLTSRHTLYVLISFVGYNELEYVMVCPEVVPVLIVRRWILGGYWSGRGYAMWAVGWCECVLFVGMCIVKYLKRNRRVL